MIDYTTTCPLNGGICSTSCILRNKSECAFQAFIFETREYLEKINKPLIFISSAEQRKDKTRKYQIIYKTTHDSFYYMSKHTYTDIVEFKRSHAWRKSVDENEDLESIELHLP